MHKQEDSIPTEMALRQKKLGKVYSCDLQRLLPVKPDSLTQYSTELCYYVAIVTILDEFGPQMHHSYSLYCVKSLEAQGSV